MTRHPAREVAHPFTDPTDWRDELDDIRAMLAEAGRSGPLRDEIAQLLVEAGRGDRIVLALRNRQQSYGQHSAVWVKPGTRAAAAKSHVGIKLQAYKRAADVAEATK